MLRRRKSLPLNLAGVALRRQSFRLLGTKSCRRYVHKKDDDDENRNSKEGQERHIHLHKSRGQHILTNHRVLEAIVRKSEIRPTDTVLEIGPGTGNLTMKLLEAAKKVIAVEIDKRMVDILCKRVAERGFEDRLTVICKDALKTEFPIFDLVVANIPYGISSPLIAKLAFGVNPFRSATLLLQKEFARRLLANPGDSEFNRLAVNVKLVAEVEYIMDVSKRDFVPYPKVDSSVVKIRPKTEIPDVDMNEWWAFTRTCFSKKNKTLGATFKQKKKVIELLKRSQEMNIDKDLAVADCNFDGNDDKEEESDDGDCSSSGSEKEKGLFREKIVGVLKAGRFEEKRPSKLSNEELLHLLSLFNQAGIHFHDQAKGNGEGKVAFVASYSP
ncbi:hypothetical protein HHK36_010195 [Tetracentron sinense]|uniref:rRNA adenine N(6)-methyltransferase n=1 Tax=Tetracentron sinense TaxID=13715 RepID=A0A834ZHI4_TETSI|nr:hypothetical protein HHK36_010195 [Tetracentron sinense]